MSLDSLFTQKPKKVDEGAETENLKREREALLKRSRVDQNTTVAGNKESVGTQTFRSTLGR